MGVYGTPLVKVLFRTPLLFAHRTLYRPNARGARPHASVSSWNYVLCHLTFDQLGYQTTRMYAYPAPAWSALFFPPCNRTWVLTIRTLTLRQLSWSALFFSPVKRTWVPD